MARTATRSGLYRAKVGFAAERDGREYVVRAGELFDAKHVLVRTCADWFEPAETAARPTVEQTTAEPGAVRGEE